ncbi:MAG: hypothetical protein EOP05_04380 [Proteobacteria bacterium]|nr:MAG: hypothetical protein EOP05_04380 [Pseudomonadota bacterium]
MIDFARKTGQEASEVVLSCGACSPTMLLMKHGTALLTFILLALSLPTFALAQNDGSIPSDEISLFVGTHLPDQIPNVTETLPVFGARYGFGTRRFGIVEAGVSNTHAKGVDFSNFSLSLRGNVPFDDGIVAIFFAGADANYYKPETEFKRRFEAGWHVGTGAMVQASNNLWFRGDIKFMGGPGVNLFVLFGLVFQLNDSTTGR